MAKSLNETRVIKSNTAKTLKSKDKPYQVNDKTLKGYYIRVPTDNGKKTYNLRVKVLGELHHEKIGDCSLMTEAEAREKATQFKKQLREGKKPITVDEKINDKTTLLEVLEDYIAVRGIGVEIKESYAKQMRANIKRTPFAKMKIIDIESKAIREWYRKGKVSPHATEYTYKNIKTLLTFAKSEDHITINPTDKLAYMGRYKANVSDLHIPLKDISEWMASFVALSPTLPKYGKERQDTSGNMPKRISKTARDFILFILTTGVRKAEARDLTWADVDFDNKHLDIPRNKRERFMRIPMTRLTHDMLLWRKKQNFPTKWVFPNSTKTGGFYYPDKALKKISNFADVGYVINAHALRHTFATYCAELNYNLEDTGRLLNHSKRDITDNYVAVNLEKQVGQYEEVFKLVESRQENWIDMGGKTYKTRGVYNFHRVYWYDQDYDWFTIETQPSKEKGYWSYLDYEN